MVPQVRGAAAIAIALLLSAGSAHASLMLTLTSGAASKTVVDNGAFDLDPGIGQILFSSAVSGAVGKWVINNVSGIGSALLGNGHIDLNSINAISGLPASPLVLTLTDSGQTGGMTAAVFNSIGGTLAPGATLTSTVLIDGVPHASQSFNTTPFMGLASDTVAYNSLYTLGLRITLTHTQRNLTSSFDNEVHVPEPATLGLFGVGAGAVAMAAGRRKQV